MNVLKLKFKGKKPLLMHNARLADQLDEYTKALKKATDNDRKTDAGHKEISRCEFVGGLYIDDDGLYLPSEYPIAVINCGARLMKKGTAVSRGVMIFEEKIRLRAWDANGKAAPKTSKALWKLGRTFVDRRSVKNQRNRVMRTRPKFPKWEMDFDLCYDPEMINQETLTLSAEKAGNYIGMGDFRPACRGTFGRFDVEVLEHKENVEAV